MRDKSLRVFSSDNRALIGHVRNVLASHNIETVLRNDFLSGASGEIPFVETWPEIWLQHPADVERAKALIGQVLAESDEPGPDWSCSQCNETVGGQFATCWNCGAAHPEE